MKKGVRILLGIMLLCILSGCTENTDGSHAYPDEYLEDNAQVEVTGIFETYTEEGDSNRYCRLKDAVLVVEP